MLSDWAFPAEFVGLVLQLLILSTGKMLLRFRICVLSHKCNLSSAFCGTVSLERSDAKAL